MPAAAAALAALSSSSVLYISDARRILGRARAVELAGIAERHGHDLLVAAMRKNDVAFARWVVDRLDLGREETLASSFLVGIDFCGDSALDVLEMLVSSGRPAFGVRSRSNTASDRSGHGEQPLVRACWSRCLGVVKMLISHGAPLNGRSITDLGAEICPAGAAIYAHADECLRELLIRGANPHCALTPHEGVRRESLLRIAVSCGRPSAVCLVLRALSKRGGYDLKDLGSCLCLSAHVCRSPVIPDMLINAGGSSWYKKLIGSGAVTPFLYATGMKRERVARYLFRRSGRRVLTEVGSNLRVLLSWLYSELDAYLAFLLFLRLGLTFTGKRFKPAWEIARRHDSVKISELLLRHSPTGESNSPEMGALARVLSLASVANAQNCVDALIACGCLRSENLNDGVTSLCGAMLNDNRALYQELLCAGAEMNFDAALDCSVIGQYLHGVRVFADARGEPVEVVCIDLFKRFMGSRNVNDLRCYRNGGKALHVAANAGLLVHTDFLLEEAHANVNVCNDYCETPLMEAITGACDDIVSRLVKVPTLDISARTCRVVELHAPNQRIYTRPGCDAFLFAAICGRMYTIDLLAENGVNVNTCDDQGRNALWLVVHDYDTLEGDTSIAHRENIVYRLLVLGVSGDCVDSVTGARCMHVAAKFGLPGVIRLLSVNGIDVNARDFDGNTALHWTVKGRWFGSSFIVELVRDLGAEVNSQNTEGETALFISARYGAVQDAERLVEAGADVNLADTRGRTPLMVACNAAALGKPRRRRDGAKWRAERLSPLSTVQILLNTGADICRSSTRGLQAMHFAAANNQTDVCRVLVSRVRKSDLNVRSDSGLTPLHLACRRGHVAAAEVLLEAGARPNQEDNLGQTPLHHAVKRGHVGCVSALLLRGAKASLRCSAQLLPLDLAKRNGDSKAAAALSQQSEFEGRNYVETFVSEAAAFSPCSSRAATGRWSSFVGGDDLLTGADF